MKFSLIFFFMVHSFHLTVFSAFLKNLGRSLSYPINTPHEITLSEDQKNEGKSKIVFTQDPGSFFYILVTPPLIGNTKADFDYDIDINSFLVTTKATAKKHYEAVVNFIKPIQPQFPKKVEIESHGADGSFTVTLRISKTIPKNEGEPSIKTFYKQKKLIKKAPEIDLRDDSLKDLVDSMNKNAEGELAKSVVGMMNSFNDSLSNPNLQENFNQTYYSTDEVAQNSSATFNDKLQEMLGPVNQIVDSDAIKKDLEMPNKEEFAKNASEALDSVESGDTSALENLLSSIDTDKIQEKGEKSSKKQMEDEEKQKQTQDFINQNQPIDDSMKQNSEKENEKNKEEKEKDQEAKKKQAEKDKVLQSANFNFYQDQE